MNKRRFFILASIIAASLILIVTALSNGPPFNDGRSVSHVDRWGIYSLEPEIGEVEVLYTSTSKLSRIRLSNGGDRLVFSKHVADEGDACAVEGTPIDRCEEICVLNLESGDFRRLTDNEFMDICPSWSADDSQIAFLSFRKDMDIYSMKADGSTPTKLYDSGSHDSDLHYSGDRIVFTRNSQIWMMNDDGTNVTQVTEPPQAGEWGDAVLPFGDYDPNLSPDGARIAFERLVDDNTSHGNYDIHVINIDGTGEEKVTDTGYTQGLPTWSHSGEQIVYLVGAVGNEGKYDVYLMNSDGSDNHTITPEYFPSDFLCHDPIFSKDDSRILFIGEWYNT